VRVTVVPRTIGECGICTYGNQVRAKYVLRTIQRGCHLYLEHTRRVAFALRVVREGDVCTQDNRVRARAKFVLRAVERERDLYLGQ
jgi:hypothetical protein